MHMTDRDMNFMWIPGMVSCHAPILSSSRQVTEVSPC
jgi:hypothetical protein